MSGFDRKVARRQQQRAAKRQDAPPMDHREFCVTMEAAGESIARFAREAEPLLARLGEPEQRELARVYGFLVKAAGDIEFYLTQMTDALPQALRESERPLP